METSFIRSAVKEKKLAISAGSEDPPVIVEVTGGLLVVDGTHRVRAHYELKHAEALWRVREVHDDEQQRHYQREFDSRTRDRISFANIPEVASEEERQAKIQEEQKVEDDALWLSELTALEEGAQPNVDDRL